MQGGSAAGAGISQYVRIDPATWQTVKDQSTARFSSLRPVKDFFDKNRFSKPASISAFTSRLNYNLVYFQNNYILIVLIITAYLLFTNFWLLLAILVLLGGFKFISSLPANQPTLLFGRVQMTSGQLWIAYGFTAVMLIWISSATSSLFWLASVCALVISFHAGMMEPPIEADFAQQQV
ncbi:hypothetical protein HDU85_003352 [Gaertneriomyces sp. JEL0708]|nr:hypothetical protein HDU85_003352 [Gaertneriomyces sp. JEL0708]